MDLATAQKELKRLSAVTGMFDSLTDEQIAANAGKTFQDVTALRDPMAGLEYGGDDTGPFEVTVGDSLTNDFNPYHDPADGKFTSGGMGGDYDPPEGITTNARGEKTLDKTERERYSKILVGVRTVDGEEVKSLYEHLYDRAAQRKTSPGQIRELLKDPDIVYPGNKNGVANTGGRRVYQKGRYKVVFDSGTGEVVTIVDRKEKKV